MAQNTNSKNLLFDNFVSQIFGTTCLVPFCPLCDMLEPTWSKSSQYSYLVCHPLHHLSRARLNDNFLVRNTIFMMQWMGAFTFRPKCGVIPESRLRNKLALLVYKRQKLCLLNIESFHFFILDPLKALCNKLYIDWCSSEPSPSWHGTSEIASTSILMAFAIFYYEPECSKLYKAWRGWSERRLSIKECQNGKLLGMDECCWERLAIHAFNISSYYCQSLLQICLFWLSSPVSYAHNNKVFQHTMTSILLKRLVD